MFAEDPNIFLRDFGVACSCGGYSFTGILDQPSETLSMAGVAVLSTMYALTMKTSDVAAGGIDTGSEILVSGQSCTVRDVLSADDGVFSTLTLSR